MSTNDPSYLNVVTVAAPAAADRSIRSIGFLLLRSMDYDAFFKWLAAGAAVLISCVALFKAVTAR